MPGKVNSNDASPPAHNPIRFWTLQISLGFEEAEPSVQQPLCGSIPAAQINMSSTWPSSQTAGVAGSPTINRNLGSCWGARLSYTVKCHFCQKPGKH